MQNIKNAVNTETKQVAFHWYRQTGLIISLLVLIIAVTGFILNHAKSFGLNSNYMKSENLLVDLPAILLIVLSIMGVWIYAKRSWLKRNRNQLPTAAKVDNRYSAADLKHGEEGVVLTVIGDEALRQRLASMGVMPGTTIATPSTSAFGAPRTFLIKGYQLCMRSTEASMVLLQPKTKKNSAAENEGK